MFTPTSKVFLPVAGMALFLAAAYKILTGDLLGGVLYLMVGTVSFLLGVMLSTVRENELVPAVAPDAPPPAVRPVAVLPVPGGGGWSALGALSVGLVLLGLVQHALFTWAGVLVALAAGAGWLARTASENTGRPISLLPLGLPVVSLFTIASVMYFFSRILLAVSETASWVIALFAAVVIMGGAILAVVRPQVTGRTLMAMLVLGSVATVGGGIIAAAQGERHIELHAEHHGGEGALAQVVAENTTFLTDTFALPANAEVEVRFENNDRGVQHNISILREEAPQALFRGQLVTGVATVAYRFHTPGPGEYRFQCDVHPDQMNGSVRIR